MKTITRLFIILLLLSRCSSCSRHVYTVNQSHYEKGMQALANRDYLNAEKELQQEIDMNNQHVAAYCALGKIYLNWNRLNEAEHNYDKALSIDPNYTEALVGMANIHIEKLQLDEARSNLDKIFLVSEHDADAYYLLGIIEMKNQNWTASDKALRRTLEINPHHTQAQLKLKEVQQYEYDVSIDGSELFQKKKMTRAEIAHLLAHKFTPNNEIPASDTRIDDVRNHPSEHEIKFIVDLKIMRTNENKFQPKEYITKSELAHIGQTLIVREIGDSTLESAFLKTTSPFGDINSSFPFYNAVILATSYGLMEAESDGQFHPFQEVSGKDVIQFLTKAEQLSLF